VLIERRNVDQKVVLNAVRGLIQDPQSGSLIVGVIIVMTVDWVDGVPIPIIEVCRENAPSTRR